MRQNSSFWKPLRSLRMLSRSTIISAKLKMLLLLIQCSFQCAEHAAAGTGRLCITTACKQTALTSALPLPLSFPASCSFFFDTCQRNRSLFWNITSQCKNAGIEDESWPWNLYNMPVISTRSRIHVFLIKPFFCHVGILCMLRKCAITELPPEPRSISFPENWVTKQGRGNSRLVVNATSSYSSSLKKSFHHLVALWRLQTVMVILDIL